MPRLAANDPGYQFGVVNKNTGALTEWGFTLDSVTTILKETLGKPAGAMSWWGFRVGLQGVIAALDEDPGAALETSTPEELEELLKARGVSPNMSLDSASSRGHAAHAVMEELASGDYERACELAAFEVTTFGTHYGDAVLGWWAEQGFTDDFIADNIVAERPVWSLSRGYAGTLDLAIEWDSAPSVRDYGWEVLDLKTHKPASGFTKPGFGCAYVSDVIQIGAYRTAWEEMGLGKTIGQRVVVARENGQWLEDDRECPPEVFDDLIRVYRHKLNFEKGQA